MRNSTFGCNVFQISYLLSITIYHHVTNGAPLQKRGETSDLRGTTRVKQKFQLMET